MQPNVWMYLFFSLLVIAVLTIAYQDMRQADAPLQYYKDKYEDLMGKRAKATPLKRCVTAEDVAETMMSLVQSNRFVTGEVIVIDGGFTSST